MLRSTIVALTVIVSLVIPSPQVTVARGFNLCGIFPALPWCVR